MSGHPTKPILTAFGSTRWTSTSISVVRPLEFERLTHALDEVVAGDAGLAAARTALLTPLRLLDALGQEAEAALGDDVIAAERLRLLISLAEAHAPPMSMITSMLPTSTLSGATSSLATGSSAMGSTIAVPPQPGTPCEPALLDVGALVILGLAAGRVGLSIGLGEPMMNNVLGLALSAGPAEVLARALAGGMSATQLGALLAGLSAHENGNRTVSATVAAFLADACERKRWACLGALFARIGEDVASTPWDAAGAGSIVSIEPRDACARDVITLVLDRSDDQPGTLGAAHFLPLLSKRQARVVFAAPGAPSIARRGTIVDIAKGTVQVRVPPTAHAGWIGFYDPALLRTTNEARLALRAAWTERNKQSCLRAAPVPVEAIPLLHEPPTPPRTPSNGFEGGFPRVIDVSLTPAVVSIGESVELRWQVQGATNITFEPEPEGDVPAAGKTSIVATAEHAYIERVIIAENRCGQSTSARVRSRVRARITDLQLAQDGRTGPLVAGIPVQLHAAIVPPDTRAHAFVAAGTWVHSVKVDNGHINVTIPETAIVDGLVGTLRVFGPNERVDDERTFGPLSFVAQQQRTLVLLRPATIGRAFHRITAVDATTAVEIAGRKNQLRLNVVEPAWVDDEDVTCTAQPDGRDVPETMRLLERLNLLAARNPGFEEALWIALVPTPASGTGFQQVVPAEGARGVGVATPDMLADALAVQLPPALPRTQRLRVIGTIASDFSIRLESLRVEERMAGPGAPIQTDLSVFGLAGNALRTSHPISVLSRTRPARIVAIVPITDDVTALAVARNEFEGGDDYLCMSRAFRPEGEPALAEVTVNGRTVAWEYDHSRSARAAFAIEVGQNGSWSPLVVVGPCSESVELPLERIAPAAHAERVRVVASDGWNTAIGPLRGLPLEDVPEHRVVARAAGNGGFWADIDFDGGEFDEADITWLFGNEEKQGTFVKAPHGFTGDITLFVVGPEGTLQDTRRVGSTGAAIDRNMRWPQGGGTRV